MKASKISWYHEALTTKEPRLTPEKHPTLHQTLHFRQHSQDIAVFLETAKPRVIHQTN